MKRIFYGYLNGLHQLMRKVDDTEMYVIMIIMFIEFILIGFLSLRFDFKIPFDTFLPNKWLSRLVGGMGLYAVNKYVFGFRENNYSKYEPMPKNITLIVTMTILGLFIVSLILKDFIPMMKK